MTAEQQIPRVKRDSQGHPLSWFQERMWLLNQKNPGDLSYNIPVSFLIEGAVDVEALTRSLTEILRRHETLRARFAAGPRGEPVQSIAPVEAFALPLVQVQPSEVSQQIRANAEHVFDLSTGPLVIGRLLRLEPQKHLLLLNVHHIAADGWSIEGILFAELQSCYMAFAVGKEPVLPLLPIQYTDFAHWQRKLDLSADLAYWQKSLADYEDSLELPTDFLRLPQSGSSSSLFVHRYSSEFSRELDRFAQAHGCTLFMALLAGFALAVNRYTGREDLCIGTTTSGRMRPELEGLIGFFINILPLRLSVDESATVEAYMQAVRQVAIAGFDHQSVPFERVLYSLGFNRSAKANPLVPLVLRHQNFPHTRMDGGLPGGAKFLPYSGDGDEQVNSSQGVAARCEVELSYTGDRDELKVEVVFASDLYRRETIERLLARHEHILSAMFADKTARLQDLPLLTPADVQRLCLDYNQTDRDSFDRSTFVQRWDAQVLRAPDAVSCIDVRGPWRYGEVATKANRLANILVRRGISPGDVVGVCMDRGAPLVLSILAIWKAGAAYVPLDPSYPESYLQQILSNATPKLTICTAQAGAKLGLAEADSCVLDPQLELLSGPAELPPAIRPSAEDLAYIMYTSGSTGTPKGVRVPHRQLINWLGGIEAMWPFSPDEVVGQKTTMAFAVSVKEMFAGLLNGCPLAFLDTATVQDPVAFFRALNQYRVSRLNLVPSHLEALLTYLRREGLSLRALRICITAGEPLTAELVKEFRALVPQSRLLNNYGCTELNDITYYDATEFDGTDGFVPIGRPIQNSKLYVLDRKGRLVPEGVAGELHVATDSMSNGYHGRPELTAERYLKNPFSSDPNSVLYNTGDVVKYLPDGNIEFIGRWDFQVKIRGFRVDVRHVEKVLGEFEGMGPRAVVGDGNQLVAFYVEHPLQPIDLGRLREHLAGRLPGYMVPSAFVAVDAMPRLPNGKLDRRALKVSAGKVQRSDSYEAPQTDTEELLVTIWAELLEMQEDEIGRYTNFFEIGGHSLAATRFVARIKEQLGLEIGLSQVFEHPRLHELAAYVADAAKIGGIEDDDSVVVGPSGGSHASGPGLLEGKVILVTGASRGIGSTTVRLLASQGASIAINYVQSQARAARAKALIQQEGGVAEIFQADITDPDQVTELVRQVRARFGRIDVLVANAAIGFKIQPFLDFAWSDFERKMTDELKSIYYLCQAVVPEMVERKSGSIVAVSSSMSKVAQVGYVAHSSAKAALDAFVRALAIELGPDGVRINTVAPGLTLTDATANLPHQQKDAAAMRCPLRRNGLPRDVAGAILFLASDLSQFITGSYIPVDGGFTML